MRTVIVLIVYFFSLPVFAEQQNIKISATQIDNLGIKLGKLQSVTSSPLLEAPAQVSIPAANKYFVSSSYAGLITRIYVNVGDRVDKNQLLATIKSAELLTLQQHHLSSINDLQLAEADFFRDQQLNKEGVIAERRWLQSKSRYQIAMAHFNETRQLLEISGVAIHNINDLEKTRRLNSELKIISPIAGILLESNVIAGERVDALAPLFRIANLDTLWLDISIPQQHIEQVHLGDQVMVEGSDADAEIFLIAKNVDTQNQTILVRAKIRAMQDNIRLGQTVNVKISQKSTQSLFKVPNSALAQSSGITYLFVRNPDGFIAQAVQVLGRERHESIVNGDNIHSGIDIAIQGAVALKANLLGLGGDE